MNTDPALWPSELAASLKLINKSHRDKLREDLHSAQASLNDALTHHDPLLESLTSHRTAQGTRESV